MVSQNSESDIEEGIVFNKRGIFIKTKTSYRSIASDLVKFLIRYRFENYHR